MNWYDWHTVAERLQGRAYAITRGRPYKLTLDPDTPTGACDFTHKRIVINPNLFSDSFRRMGLTGNSLDKANFLVSRAVTGHESLHVLYTDPAIPLAAARQPVVKTVVNLLEDARIERIGSQTSHVAKTLFEFVNGVAARELPEFGDTELSDPYSGLDLLLRWRLGAAIPNLEPAGAKKWKKVESLARQALYAPDTAGVLKLARRIVRLLGLTKKNSETSDALDRIKETMERAQSETTGSRSSPPLPNPAESPQDSAGEGDEPSSDADPESGDESPNQGEHDDAPDLQREEAAEDNDVGAAEQGEPRLDDRQADLDEEGDVAQAVDVQDGETGSADGAQDVGVEASDSPEPEEDIEALVESTASAVSEDFESLLPDESPLATTVARARSSRGRSYPDIHASPYIDYLPESASIAAELVRELKAESPRAVSGASEYPGRFKARYFLRDSSRPFAAQRFRGIATPPMALSLVIDRSGSMEYVVRELRVMAMAIAMACDTLAIPLSIWVLEGQVHIKHFEEHGWQVLAKIAGIQAETMTTTLPTMLDAVEDLRGRPESLKQIVMIHDGMPSDSRDFVDWRTRLRGVGLFCMHIMDAETYDWFRQEPNDLRDRMDELVGPTNYAIAPVTQIAAHWCSFVRNTRDSHA